MAEARARRPQSESLLSALVTDHARRQDGSKERFAERVSLSRQRLSNLAAGAALNASELDKLSKDLGMPRAALERLGDISVVETCQSILSGGAPTGNTSGVEADPEAQVITQRFINIISDREESMPSAAYIIFLTGDIRTKSTLVDLLEQHGEAFPPATPVATIELILNLSDPDTP